MSGNVVYTVTRLYMSLPKSRDWSAIGRAEPNGLLNKRTELISFIVLIAIMSPSRTRPIISR